MKSRGAWLAVATSLAAVLACGGGNNGSNNGANGNGSGSGGFPFSGPSCNSSTIGGCFGCLESSCNGGCLTSACSDFFGCFCNCAQGDNSCYQSCSGSISASCEQCVTSVASCAEGSCASACGAAGSSGVGPPGGSGSSGGSSGGGMFQSCGGNGVVCADGSQMEFCQTRFQNMCTSAFYQVGLQTFPCASCTDVTACLQEAQNACGPSVVDAGPPPFDVGPVPDAPFLDGGSQVCTPHACGTMGQSMLFCEDFDANNTCTFAWFESGGQTFDCNSCSDCTTAAQEASKACP